MCVGMYWGSGGPGGRHCKSRVKGRGTGRGGGRVGRRGTGRVGGSEGGALGEWRVAGARAVLECETHPGLAILANRGPRVGRYGNNEVECAGHLFQVLASAGQASARQAGTHPIQQTHTHTHLIRAGITVYLPGSGMLRRVVGTPASASFSATQRYLSSGGSAPSGTNSKRR